MGNSHNTNLRKNCTSFEGTSTTTRACFGDSFRVDMMHYKGNDYTEVWSAKYKIGEKLEEDVDLQLRAKHDNKSKESIHFALHNYADNKTDILVNITRCYDGLQGGITGIKSSEASTTFVSIEKDYLIDTTIISCDSSIRDSFFILQMKKMKYSDSAFKVAMAHYYVTKTVGLYVEATICRNRDKGFVVEVNGPFIYPSVYLRRVRDITRLTGIWSPGGKPSEKETTGNSSSSLHGSGDNLVHDGGDNLVHGGGDNLVVGQIVKNASNKGLINANGYTNGSLNNSIICTIM